MKSFLFLVASLALFNEVTFSQEERLDVDGAIKIGNTGGLTPDAGTIRWTGTDFEGWNGDFWVSFTNGMLHGTVSDMDGHTYRTVVIGTQEWMAENLRSSKYLNGDIISKVADSTLWANANFGAYCWYVNDSTANEQPYGKLYNWYAVNDGRSICPSGWHIPAIAEFTVLTDFLGGDLLAGGKMKEAGFNHWSTPNTAATNASGFTGLPAGSRNPISIFQSIHFSGIFWSTSESSSTSAEHLNLNYATGLVQVNDNNKRFGFSVRCLKN